MERRTDPGTQVKTGCSTPQPRRSSTRAPCLVPNFPNPTRPPTAGRFKPQSTLTPTPVADRSAAIARRQPTGVTRSVGQPTQRRASMTSAGAASPTRPQTSPAIASPARGSAPADAAADPRQPRSGTAPIAASAASADSTANAPATAAPQPLLRAEQPRSSPRPATTRIDAMPATRLAAAGPLAVGLTSTTATPNGVPGTASTATGRGSPGRGPPRPGTDPGTRCPDSHRPDSRRRDSRPGYGRAPAPARARCRRLAGGVRRTGTRPGAMAHGGWPAASAGGRRRIRRLATPHAPDRSLMTPARSRHATPSRYGRTYPVSPRCPGSPARRRHRRARSDRSTLAVTSAATARPEADPGKHPADAEGAGRRSGSRDRRSGLPAPARASISADRRRHDAADHRTGHDRSDTERQHRGRLGRAGRIGSCGCRTAAGGRPAGPETLCATSVMPTSTATTPAAHARPGRDPPTRQISRRPVPACSAQARGRQSRRACGAGGDETRAGPGRRRSPAVESTVYRNEPRSKSSSGTAAPLAGPNP